MRFQQGWEDQQKGADYDLVGSRQTFTGRRSEINVANCLANCHSTDQKQKQPNPFQLFFLFKRADFGR